MSEELFGVEVGTGKSPRLRWIERHGLKTKFDPDWSPGDEDDLGREKFPWYVARTGANITADFTNARTFGGATEDDALAAWARANGHRMWNEEPL